MLTKVTGLMGRSREDLAELDFLVDMGSFYTAIAPHARYELRSPPGIPARVMLADQRIVDAELTVAHLRLDGRETAIPVEIMEGTPHPLLGVSALEALGVKVNRVSGELEIVWPFSVPPSLTRFRGLR